MRRVMFLVAMACLAVLTAKAQDPAKVDPKHCKVEFENAQVRVLRFTLGPHEKLPMHEHPASVLISMTDSHGKEIFPDGKEVDRQAKAGEVRWRDAVKHANENLGDKPTESIVVELKAKPAKAAAKPPAAKKKM